MTEPGTWRFTLSLDRYEFTLDYLAVDCDRLEISHLVGQFSIPLLTSEIVNTVLDRITLKLKLKNLVVNLPYVS